MIDWDRVENLKSEIGVEDFDEVVQLFFEEVEEVMFRLRTTPNPASYEADLHFLKGSALSLGLSDFSELCQLGEKASAAGQTELVDIGEVITMYEASRMAFVAGLRAPERASNAA